MATPSKSKVQEGDVFGMLTIKQFVGVTPLYKKHVWLAVCSCGVTVVVKSQELLCGDTRSCGCLHKAALVARNKANAKHQRSRSPEYKSWRGAKDRCTNTNSKDWPRYGARGITMCEQWLNSFEAFLSDMGQKPSPKHSLERIDVNKGYFPGNCCWATAREQCLNRRSTVFVTEGNETLCISDWGRKLGVTDCAIRKRLKNTGSVYGNYARR